MAITFVDNDMFAGQSAMTAMTEKVKSVIALRRPAEMVMPRKALAWLQVPPLEENAWFRPHEAKLKMMYTRP